MTSKKVILAVKQGKYSPCVPLNEVFLKTVVSLRVINKKTLVVKVIKQLNAKEFLVADATGFCKIQITSGFINGKQNLQENNYVEIRYAKVDYVVKKIFLYEKAEVLPMAKEFQLMKQNQQKIYLLILTKLSKILYPAKRQNMDALPSG